MSNPEAQIGGLGPCPTGLASRSLKSWLWQHPRLGPTTLPKSPPFFPNRPLPRLPSASAQGQSLIRPCWHALSWEPGSWSTALPTPRPPAVSPGAPSPTSSHPCNLGSSSGPLLNPTAPALCSCPLESTSASVSPAHVPTSLLFTFLMTHRAQGIRGALAPATASWTMPLLCHGGPRFPHHWGLGPGDTMPPQGGESPFPSNWGFHPLSGAGGEGRRQRRCRSNKRYETEGLLTCISGWRGQGHHNKH